MCALWGCDQRRYYDRTNYPELVFVHTNIIILSIRLSKNPPEFKFMAVYMKTRGFQARTQIVTKNKEEATNLLFLSEQLLVLLSVTPELLSQLHLTVDGLSQVLGQNVLMSLTRTQRTR